MNTSSLSHLLDPVTGQQLDESNLIGFCEYYDGIPVLFVIENQKKELFLAVWSGHCKHKAEIWLYAPVTRDRYEQAIAGNVQLKDLFIQADGGSAYKVIIYHGLKPLIYSLKCSAIPDCWLPEANEYIHNSH